MRTMDDRLWTVVYGLSSIVYFEWGNLSAFWFFSDI